MTSSTPKAQTDNVLDQLRASVEKEFGLFSKEYNRRICHKTPLLDEVGQYLADCPGKQLRPLLVLLSAKACGTLHPHHIRLAAAMELLHNATLLHDDVVDDSDLRRGQDSVRHRWDNPTAVLCGDYYLAQVMSLLQEVGDNKVSGLVSQTVATMSQGELWQLSLARQGKATVEEYLTVIGCKTASLMATCCQLGAISFEDTVRESCIEKMQQFGYHYGIVFQLQDDLKSLDRLHDVALPEGVDPLALVVNHTRQARQALEGIPDSPALNALLSLLDSSAPQPE